MRQKRRNRIVGLFIFFIIMLLAIQGTMLFMVVYKARVSQLGPKCQIVGLMKLRDVMYDFDQAELKNMVKNIHGITKDAFDIKLSSVERVHNQNNTRQTVDEALEFFAVHGYWLTYQYYPKANAWVEFRFTPQSRAAYFYFLTMLIIDIFLTLSVAIAFGLYVKRRFNQLIDRYETTKKSDVKGLSATQKRLQDKIEDLVSNQTLLLSTLFHDLKTPLTRATLATEFMPQETPKLENLKSDLSEIDSMLQSTIAYYQGKLKDAKTSLYDVLMRLQKIDPKQIVCEKLAEAQKVWISADENLLFRALMNICQNALKYAGSCRISYEINKSHLRLFIADQGPGVSDDMIGELFVAQRKNLHHGQQSTGYGLGLAISKKIIMLLNGEITVKNTHPGLLFTVILPLHSGDEL
ncbi:sensor histidine kinase [Cysteiniphilum litorale]|uniref:sensor histidine kinase n=1 Tax=Cysteiniphilum litorale TaxID=2056700 RepID=UPI003F885D6D